MSQVALVRINNLKIGTRLIGGFEVLALVLAGVSLLGCASGNWTILIVGIFGVLLAVGWGIVLTRSITVPLAQTVTMIQEMSQGHFRMRLRMNRQDEVGVMARALDQLADDFQTNVVGIMRKLAAGDLSAEVTLKDNQDEVSPALQATLASLRELVDEMKRLTQATVEGNLEAQANADQFQGGYKEIVQDVNRSLRYMRSYLNLMPVSALVIDRQFNIKYMNKAGAETLGRSVKEIVGAKCYDLFKTDDCRTDRCACACTMQSGQPARSETHARPNGNDLEISYAAVPVKDRENNVIGAWEIVTDQTALKRAGRVAQKIADFQSAELSKLKEGLAQMAQGDLNTHWELALGDSDTTPTRQAFQQVAEGLARMVAGLKHLAFENQQAAVNISSAAAEILASSTHMASTMREQASAVNQVTSAVQEIKASAEQVAQRAQGVAEGANRAAQVAQRGAAAAQASLNGMGDIRQKVETIAENILALLEKTQQVGKIIDTVSNIASRSNLLALNAAIEATQAGEAGKGFRVVADEVRSLAEQSRQAAAQVKMILGDIQKATNLAVMATEQGTRGVNEGSELANRTAQTITELAQVVEQSAQAARQIAAGVEQQMIGLDQIAMAMKDVNQAAQQSAAGAQQSERAAEDLNHLAVQLTQVVAQYRM